MRSQIRRKLSEIPLQSGVACPLLELYCFLKNPEEFESNSHWYTVSDNSVSCYVVGKREKLDLCVPSPLLLLWWFTVTGVRWVYARAPECGGILIPPPPEGDSGPNINWAIQQRHRIDLGQFDSGMELRYIFFCGCPFPKPVLVDIIMFYFAF